MSDRKIKFIGVFPSQFPGWGKDEKPFRHKAQTFDAENRIVETDSEYVCDMFHPPGSPICFSFRYSPMGVAGIDVNGDCWVLARDMALPSTGGASGLRWVKFPVEVAE